MSHFAFLAAVQRFCVLLAIAILLAGGLIGKADAHLVTGFNIRVVHFEHQKEGMIGYFRMSLPLVVGNSPTRGRSDQEGRPAPYIYSRLESGRVFHYVDNDAMRQDISGLGRLVAEGHLLVVAGKIIQPRVLSARVHPKGFVPPFNTLDQVRAAVGGPAYPGEAPVLEARHVLVDVALFYPEVEDATQFQFSSRLNPADIGEPDTNNVLFDHKGDTVVTYAVAGLLGAPVTVNPSLSGAIRQFLVAGVRHILEGMDHLLFIVCVVIVDFRPRPIALRITGFSVGHSISLIAGFYGWIPAGTWFPPLIEVSIALSILGAALLILFASRFSTFTLPLTALVGLVHGFGFAFGLREMLADSSLNIVPSLLSFNLGVEAGQLIVAFGCWAALCLTQRIRTGLFPILRIGIAASSAVVSVFWLTQRIPLVLSDLW